VAQEFYAGFPKLALLHVCCQVGCPEEADCLLQMAAVVLLPFAEYRMSSRYGEVFSIP
jgi:hypothetical protein